MSTPEENLVPCTVSTTYSPVPEETERTELSFRTRDHRRGQRNGAGTVKSQLAELNERVAKQDETIRRLGAVCATLSTLQDHGQVTGDEGFATGANRTPLGRQYSGHFNNNHRGGGNHYRRDNTHYNNQQGRAPGFRS